MECDLTLKTGHFSELSYSDTVTLNDMIWDDFKKYVSAAYEGSFSNFPSNYISKIGIKDVIFNDPATIVLWKDGTKTVVKAQPGDEYHPETGLAMCIVKKMAGNKGNYNKIFEKWLPQEEDK